MNKNNRHFVLRTKVPVIKQQEFNFIIFVSYIIYILYTKFIQLYYCFYCLVYYCPFISIVVGGQSQCRQVWLIVVVVDDNTIRSNVKRQIVL